jgi:hypothetical protein
MNKLFAKSLVAVSSTLLASLVMVGVSHATSGDFQDTANHWAKYYAQNLRDECSVQGFTDASGNLLNLFKPDQPITRAELVKIVLQCKLDPNYSYNYGSSFSDVPEGAWFDAYIGEAEHQGIVDGYSDGSFHPQQSVNRAEALKIILLARYSEDQLNATGSMNFSDVTAGSWYEKYLLYAVGNNFVDGYSDNTFRPAQAITRAEVAKIVNLVNGLQVTQPEPTPTPTPSGDVPVIAGCQIFPADNPWNQDISQLPLHPNSANFINSIGADDHLHPDFGSPAEYGIPYVIADANTPDVMVVADYADESDFGMAPIPANPLIEGTYASDGDRHVIVLDKSDCTLYETWSSYFENGIWNVGSAAKFDLDSNALRPDGWTSADAAGLPILPGLVRYDEVQAGEINHALRFTVSTTQRGYIHPATHFASSSTDPNHPPMGLRLRLKADYDISGYSAEAQVVLRALKKYGMIVADNGSDWFISGESNPNWNDEAINQLKQVPGSAFEVVNTGEIIK